MVHHVNQGLRAHKLFTETKIHRAQRRGCTDRRIYRPYDVGSPAFRWLHQAIEAKEGCPIQAENVTLASVTFQNYFRLLQPALGHDRNRD